MDTRRRVLDHLKRQGASTVAELVAGLRLSANAVRHHLLRLQHEGLVAGDLDRERAGAGRPAQRFALTPEAEGAFPKRYPELLAAILSESSRQRMLEPLLRGVVASLAEPLRPMLAPLPPRERLRSLLASLAYGDMLPTLTLDEDGWRLVAHNCVYRDAGCQEAAVCELLPNVIEAAAGLPAARVVCQRDGERTCTFAGGWRPLR